MSPDKWVTFDLKFADARALSAVPFLSHVRIDLTKDTSETRSLGVTIDNPGAAPMPEVVSKYLGGDFKIALDLPGKVLSTNGSGTGGRAVSWSLPVGDVAKRSALSFNATYQAGG